MDKEQAWKSSDFFDKREIDKLHGNKLILKTYFHSTGLSA